MSASGNKFALTALLALFSCFASLGVKAADRHGVLVAIEDAVAEFDAQLIQSQQQRAHSVQLALSKARKVNGRWGHKKQRELKAVQQQLSYRLGDEVDLTQVWSAVQQQVEQGGAQSLFNCEGLACGSSNHWANGVFKRKFLYGPDRQQYYGISRLADGVYLQRYLVRRGNQRVYMQLVLSTDADMLMVQLQPAPAQLASGSYLWRTIEASHLPLSRTQMPWLEQLKQLLEQNPNMQLILVGHDYSAQAEAKSRESASRLAATLVKNGVAKSRVSSAGSGDKTPLRRVGESTGNRARIDLVLRQPQ